MSQEKRMSRRRFLVWAAAAGAGGTIVGCGGLAAFGLRQTDVEHLRALCGESPHRVLVAYASRAGSTGGVAEAIGQTLCQAGAAADVLPAADVADVGEYDAVVVGSAVYMGRPLQAAVQLVQTHAEGLARVPVAYFCVCLTMRDPTAENRRTVAAYLDPLREAAPQVDPMDAGLFAGALNDAALPPLYRLVTRAMDQPQGDYRDWNAIRAWATDLAPLLLSA